MSVFQDRSVRIGADPEVLLVDKAGKMIASCGKFGGTKEHPLKVADHVWIQEDNVSVEFNFTPTIIKKTWLSRVKSAMNIIDTRAAAQGFRIARATAAHYTAEQLSTRQAQTFGCEPDFDLWTGKKNKPANYSGSLRCAGGHIHVGWSNPTNEERRAVAEWMELIVGVGSLVFALPGDHERRILYGKAGSIRVKPYGIEYRVPSNGWLFGDASIEWMFDATKLAVERGLLVGRARGINSSSYRRLPEASKSIISGVAPLTTINHYFETFPANLGSLPNPVGVLRGGSISSTVPDTVEIPNGTADRPEDAPLSSDPEDRRSQLLAALRYELNRRGRAAA